MTSARPLFPSRCASFSARRVQVHIENSNCSGCCWTAASGSVAADGKSLAITATGDCERSACLLGTNDVTLIVSRTLQGDVCNNGNQLSIVWSKRWADWVKDAVFDWD